jgi:hypothetical protein
MEQVKLIATLDRFKSVFDEKLIDTIGKANGFCKRLRVVTPYRLVLSLVSTMSCGRVETLADIHRGFEALFGKGVAYKPFHNQLSKEEFPRMMQEFASAIMTKLAVKTLRIKRGSPLSEFKEILIQDGSSFAVNDNLSKVFPGRFTNTSPAAVELHVTMSLLDGNVRRVALTADTEEERGHLPAPSELKGKLLLADRGYFGLEYIDELMEEETAGFVIRAQNAVNPVILSAQTAQGKRLNRLKGKRLKAVKLSKQQPTDMDAEWYKPDGCPVECRLICFWNPKTKQYIFFATNLPRERYSPDDIAQAYRLRWQIELLFKEWKSYANLHAFDTTKAAIAAGLIWATLAAAAIKRYLAHVTQSITRVEISTRKVAMCAVHILFELFHALVANSRHRLIRLWRHSIDYLASQARRAHPARDRNSNSFSRHFEPVF